MDSRSSANGPRTRVISIALGLSILTAAFSAQAAGTTPRTLVPPEKAQPVLTTAATGVQVYSCEYDKDHHLAWTFQHPEATLYDSNGIAVIEHGAGPSWKRDDDGSSIKGKLIAQAPSDNAGSIPQLLLAANVAAPGKLADVRFVQRLDTVGGVPANKTCSVEHEIGRFPYYANYVFLK
ncbi:MAG TPA: DUF3455 domain-containing protein [Trinickia sp.]|jgi:hypothetical protein|nr:DUF3455 domain-containing protein [Trinickia sp.]